MLRIASIGAAFLSQTSLAQFGEHDQYSRVLRFDEDGYFKIVTFSDIGMNNNSEDYLQTQSLIETLLNKEKPDLVVLTGDVVDPSEGLEDYDYHFTSALELIKARQVPWIWTGGSKVEGKSGYDLHELDYGYGMQLSWTGYVWDAHTTNPDQKVYDQEKLGYFTSRIPIMDPSGKEEVFSLYTLDTGSEQCLDYGIPGESCVTSEAVDWFADQLNLYSHNHKARDFVFLHKPVPEFMNLANLYNISGHKQEAISCSAINSGVFATAMESQRVVWINAGKDANNDFSGRYNEHMMFSYGRKSGYGGKGELPRGVRTFHLKLSDSHKTLHGNSYVVEGATGEISRDMHLRSPPNFRFSKQTQCSVDPFVAMFEPFMESENSSDAAATDESMQIITE